MRRRAAGSVTRDATAAPSMHARRPRDKARTKEWTKTSLVSTPTRTVVISKIKMLNFGSKSRKKLDEALKKESRPKERAFKTMPKKETQIEQNDAPCEMAEGPSEQRAQQLIAEFALEDITERRVLEFLRRMLDCCDFTTNPCTNLRMLGRLVTSHPVLAAKSFLERESNKALYFMLHRALWLELGMRGSDGVKEIFAATANSTLQRLCSFCGMLDEIVRVSVSRSKMIRFLRGMHDGGLYSDAKERKNLHNSLLLLEKEERLRQDNVLLHSLSGADTRLFSVVQITALSVDDERCLPGAYYGDTTIGWLVDRSTQYSKLDKKNFRVVHKGRSLCRPSVRNKTLMDMGIKDGDKVQIESVCSSASRDGGSSAKAANPVQLVSEFAATENINEKRVLDFLRRILNFWDTYEGFQRDEWDNAMISF